MFKIFVFVYLMLVGILTVYIWRGEGEPEYDRNIIIITIVCTCYLCFGVIGVGFQTEIKSLLAKMPRVNEVQVLPSTENRYLPKDDTVCAIVLRKSFCVENPLNVNELVKAVQKKDVDFLDQMIADGQAFFVPVDTRAYRSSSGIYDGIVFLTFTEGILKDRQGYTFIKCAPTEEEYFANKNKMYIPDSRKNK